MTSLSWHPAPESYLWGAFLGWTVAVLWDDRLKGWGRSLAARWQERRKLEPPRYSRAQRADAERELETFLRSGADPYAGVEVRGGQLQPKPVAVVRGLSLHDAECLLRLVWEARGEAGILRTCGAYVFWCPACHAAHWVSPTLRNSGGWVQDCFSGLADFRLCACRVTATGLEYRDDCSHALAGKTASLWWIGETGERVGA